MNQPRSFDTIRNVIGLEAAASLIDAAGGTSIYIPLQCKPDHRLIEIIGPDAARKMCATLYGQRVEIPTNARQKKQSRNDEIYRRFHRGDSTRQLALAFGMSQRTIRWIIRGYEAETTNRPDK